jgi:uncharacterized protein (TIGR02145 family)/uncharacterized repeat protein (TIGR02543 family)
MDGNKTLTANFEALTYTLETGIATIKGQVIDFWEQNGYVTRNPNKDVYTFNEQVTVTATPASGYTFAYWTGAASGTTATVTITMNDNKSLYAYFQEVQQTQYTLTTNASPSNGGSVSRNPNQTTYAPGTNVTVTATPANGYTFKGWSGASSSTNATVTITMNDNKTLTAGFGLPDAKQFTVYFNGNGTTGGTAPTALTADSGSNITLPDQQTMEKSGGYRFGGWNTNATGTGTNYAANAPYKVTGGATLYAVWIKTYNVTFNGNGTTAGIPDAVNNVDSGASITLPGPGNMTRTGYSFGRWNTNAAGTGTYYSAGASYTVTGNAIIYAKWIPIYTVTYNGNGNTGGNAPETVSVDSGTGITLSGHGTLAKTNYNFGGWNTNTGGTGTNYNAGTSYTVTGNVTLYVKWTAYPRYTVTYNGNGNTGGSVPTATTVDSGSTITLSGQGTLTKTGYNFGGWNTNTGGTGTNYNAGASYTVIGNVTLYVKWVAYPTYTVTYNGNGNTGGSVPTATTVDSGSVITLSGQGTLVKTGYNFGGWNTNSSGTGTNYSEGASYIVTGNVTLYAKWTAIAYTVTFNGNNNTSGNASASINADYGSSITLPSQGMLLRTGYNFGGWNTNSSSFGTNYSAGTSYAIVEDITLYAVWTPIDYKITYTLNGGTVTPANPASYMIETASFTISNPSRACYTFAGWTGSNNTTPQTSVSVVQGSTGDKSYAANWTALTYTLTTNVSPASGGTVSRSPNQISYSCGTSVTVTAILASGQTFMGWGDTRVGTTNPLPITMNSDTTLTAYFVQYGTLNDSRDGKKYNTVKINNRTWMAENLNYQTSSGSWCDNNTDTCTKYGRLYDWSTARTICPSGWYLPTDDDWRYLVLAVGGTGDIYNGLAAKNLKSTSGWYNNNGIDIYGFSALPSGGRYLNGSIDVGYDANWWTSTEMNLGEIKGVSWFMDSNNFYMVSTVSDKSIGYSVRCIQN